VNRITKVTWFLVIITGLVLSGCSGGGTANVPTVDAGPIYTEIASTAMALQTQTVQALPTATNTPNPSPTPVATSTPLITNTPLPAPASATPLGMNTAVATSQASCDNMAYVTDATIPDGYVAKPGEIMKKTWTIKNLGPCTWNQDYVLLFAWGGVGTNWDSAKPGHIPYLVRPGETVDISIELKAPSDSGTYGAFFRFQNDKGSNFGPILTILIKV
jgi:hypothetical protein